MTMLLAAQTMPFTVAFVIMIGLAIVQAASTALGGGLDDALESWLPETGGNDVLGWLHVGRAPLLVLLVLFLAAFSISGYVLQMLSAGLIGRYLPWWIAVVPAVMLALPFVRVAGGLVAKIMPNSETEVVSEASFVGRTAVVITGTAQKGNAAQAKVTDAHGLAHYVMVEPDLADAEFPSGSSVLIVKQIGGRYAVIANPHPTLM
jgi:putative Ca2+/H+ antiporter (TMEM165/GDT1 family)